MRVALMSLLAILAGVQEVRGEPECAPLEPASMPKVSQERFGRHIGDKITFKCPPGYWYTGSAERICQSNLLWGGKAGTCEKIDVKDEEVVTATTSSELIKIECKALPVPEHGTVDVDQRHVNDKATFSCNPGYKYIGPKIRTCNSDGQWSGSDGKCEVALCSTRYISYITGTVIVVLAVLLVACLVLLYNKQLRRYAKRCLTAAMETLTRQCKEQHSANEQIVHYHAVPVRGEGSENVTEPCRVLQYGGSLLDDEQKDRIIIALCKLAFDRKMNGTRKRLNFSQQDFLRYNLTGENVINAVDAGLLMTVDTDPTMVRFKSLSIQELFVMAGLLMQSSEQIKVALRKLKVALPYLFGLAKITHGITGQLFADVSSCTHVTDHVRDVLKQHLRFGCVKLRLKLQVLRLVHENKSIELAQLVGWKNISFIYLKLTKNDINAVTFFLDHCARTTTVELRHIHLDWERMQALAKFLKNNKTVKTLVLSDDGIDDAVVESLAGPLEKNNALSTLMIGSNNVTDAGVKSLAEMMKGNKTLKDVTIESDKITNNSATCLAIPLEKSVTLTHLTIVSSNVKDQGIWSLAAALKRNNTLMELRLTKTTPTDDGGEAILDALAANNKVSIELWSDHRCSDDISSRMKANSRISCIGDTEDSNFGIV